MRSTRRGITFMEVVAACALLALVAVTIVSGITFIESSAVRDRDRLAATEVAHRVILQYTNDEAGLPDQSRPYQYGDTNFRWVLNREILVSDQEDVGGSIGRRKKKSVEQATLDEEFTAQLRVITVEVYLWDDPNPYEPLARLSRVYNWFGRGDSETILKRLKSTIERNMGPLPTGGQEGEGASPRREGGRRGERSGSARP